MATMPLYMLFVLSIIGVITVMGEEFHCWPEWQRKILTFHNSNNTMEHLPTVRFIQGYWDSQWALQYVGYLYLKEKIGLNVEFFPNLSSGLTLDDLSPYPDFYWQHIADNNYDLLLEQWPVHLVHLDMYYEDGSVLNGGNNDIYGQIGQYVPDYVYDELIEGMIPEQMKYNMALRQKFIDAYTKNSYSGRDWVQYLNDTLYANNDTLTTYLNYNYSLPSYDKPIIWGSDMTYFMSRYTRDLVEYFKIYNYNNSELEAGLDWIFCPLLSETLLTEFVTDLYENTQPFIANIYYPHQDFATVSKRTGKYMRFEHIFIHSNTDNSREANCYSTYQCREPLAPLFKLGNPLLAQELPEIIAFLYAFSLLADDLNDIIHHRFDRDIHHDRNETIMTSHNKWLNATCQFLQTSDFVTTFKREIIRYDCSEYDGCGFTFTYNNDYDNINVSNIGGYCANSSSKPECICTNEYLTGDDCRTHYCDGLLGPFYNSKNNTYYFEQCGGNGICDISKQKCKCFEGYNGDGCEIVFKQFKYSTPLQALFSILFIICIMILSLSIGWLWMNQNYTTVKALSANMTTFFTVGLILLCIGTCCYLYHPLNDISCNIRNYCYGLGAILTIMAPLCKTYRVALIFSKAQDLEAIKIPDKKLVMYLLYAVFIEFLICLLYTVLHELNGGISNIYLDEYSRMETVCNHSRPVKYVELGNYLYIFVLIVILCFFSFKNRKTLKLFKESKCAYFGSFFSLFVFVVVVVFGVVVDDTMILVTIEATAMIIALCVVWILFYGLKIYKFIKYPLQRSENILQNYKKSIKSPTSIPGTPMTPTSNNQRTPPSNNNPPTAD